MNKLDEILQKLALELEVNELDMVMVTGETCREMLIKEAKQAIIELIEGEIREELEEVSPHDENNDHVKDMIAYSNGSLKILILKLAKLKE